MGVKADGSFIRFTNIKYVLSYDDAFIVGTTSCLYRLPREDEDKN